MKAVIFDIMVKKYSLGLPNNKKDSATIIPKTTVLGIIGAFIRIQRGTEAYARLMSGELLDILIESKTPLKKMSSDVKLGKDWRIVVNAEEPFRKDVVFQVTAIPTNEEGVALLKKFEEGVMKAKKSWRKNKDSKKAVYLGRQGYPLRVGKITWVDFTKLDPDDVRGKEIVQNSVIPFDGNNIEIIYQPERTVIVSMSYAMDVKGLERIPRNRRYKITTDIQPFKVNVKGEIECNIYQINDENERIIICM